jgi:8-oxo-dGTP pyrophosphatase MutT (NUDIX family)
VNLLPFDEYVASLPRKRMSAGVLLHDGSDRVVLVEPSYKVHWDLPGGVVDDGESPWHAAARELAEELGLHREAMRPLVIDHVASTDDGMPEGIAWIFDGGLTSPDELGSLHLEDPEIISVGLYDLEEVSGKVSPALARQIAVALTSAKDYAGPVLCDDGVPNGR